MVSIFTDASNIIPNASTYSKLSTALGDSYLPITIQEMTSRGSQNRIAMERQDTGIKVLFLMNRIIIEKYPIDIENSDSIGTFEEFCDIVNQIIEPLLQEFQKTANRLSLVSKYLLKKGNQEDISSISSKLFVFPPTYNESNTFEWNWRMAKQEEKQFGENIEQMNYITSINRVRGILSDNAQGQEFEGLDVEFDLNTIDENKELRFDIVKIKSFYDQAKIWHESYYTTMMNYIKG